MMSQFRIFYSNRIEALFIELRERLYSSSSHPFVRRLVVVPSPAMKSWLMQRLADDPEVGIAMGIEVTYPDQAMAKLVATNVKKPTKLAMTLAIEAEIREVIDDKSPLWQPLVLYLKGGNLDRITQSKKVEKRIASLSEKLAGLFEKYGSCGGSLLEEWKADSDCEWQVSLWHRIWSKREHWGYPYELYGHNTELKMDGSSEIHLFGLSYLTSLQNHFFTRTSEEVSVDYYLLSPCQMFWGDVLSDKENLSLQSYWRKKESSEEQQWALEEYLRDRNPLLANFGRLGREMSELIEGTHVDTEERYILPHSLLGKPIYDELLCEEQEYYNGKGPLTMLQAVQADIALLRNPKDTQPVSLEEEDTTIQVHCAATKMREVQVVYNALVSLMENNHSIKPSDVIVMAPNIMEYTPCIRTVFHEEESVLDAQIMDVVMPAQNPLIQGFLHLLEFATGRWDAVTLLQLIEFTAFQKRQGISTEDVQVIRKWIKESGIRWGQNAEHRNQLLRQSHCSSEMIESSQIGTLNDGFDRLLAGMLYSIREDDSILADMDVLPVESVDSSQCDLMGKWVHLIRSLRDDLQPLVDGTTMTVDKWASYLRCLYQGYFLSDGGDSDAVLIDQIEAFRHVSKDLDEVAFPFESVFHHFETSIKRQSTSYRETHLQAVRFCSILPMRAIPAKVVVLMGMEEEKFPKKEEHFSLNLLTGQSKADYFPSQTDFDRYLFLEMILSARDTLILTYSAENQEQTPSLVVTELLHYLDQSYSLGKILPSKQVFVRHPFHPFDKSYFNPDYPFKSYSRKHYQQALTFYRKEKISPHRFFSDFSCHEQDQTDQFEKQTLDIRRLTALAKDPIKHYMNQSLGVYLDKEKDREIKINEELSVSDLEKAILHRSGLKTPLDGIIKVAEKQGKLPFGGFKSVAVQEIHHSYETLRNNIEKAGASPDAVFSIDCAEIYKEPTQDEQGNWFLPPLQVDDITLVGSLREVVPDGLVAHVKGDEKEVIQSLPAFTFMLALIETYQLPIKPRLICAKTGQVKENLPIDPFVYLRRWIEYYRFSLKCPSPLIPSWAPFIVKGEDDQLSSLIIKQFMDAFTPFYHDYAKWGMHPEDLPDSKMIVKNWKNEASDIYGKVFESWYSKKKGK